MEVNLLPGKLPWKLVGVDLLPCIEVSGSFQGNIWKFPMSVEVEASVTSINCSVHEYFPWKLPWASIYPYILPPATTSITTSSCFHKTNPNPNPTLELPPWNLACFQLPHGSRWKSIWKLFVAFMEAGATCMDADPFPTSMEVGGSFHASRLILNEATSFHGYFHGSKWK